MLSMASHFRKLRHTLRLLPVTKSLGFSTRVNEGDQTRIAHPDVSHSNRDYILSTIFNSTHGASSEAALLCKVESDLQPLNQLPEVNPVASALVPLSCRDMTLVLLPRLKSEEALEPFMSAAKSVSFTCDDILAIPLSSEECYASNTTLERSCVKHLLPSDHTVLSKIARSELHFPEQPAREPPGIDTLPVMRASVGNVSFDKKLSDSVCMFSSAESEGRSKSTPPKNGPSTDQLDFAKDWLERSVRGIFKSRYDYGLFHKDVVLENNLFGNNKVTKGVVAYALELLKLRFRIYSRFSSTTIEILNVTVQEETGTIRFHWRLKGLPQTQVLKFWRLFTAAETIRKEDWEWLEAFSYFHVGKDGLVYKHRLDRMIPDSEEPSKLTLELKRLFTPVKPLVN